MAHCVAADVPNILPFDTKAATPPVTVFDKLLAILLTFGRLPPTKLFKAPLARLPTLVKGVDIRLAMLVLLKTGTKLVGTGKEIPVAALNLETV